MTRFLTLLGLLASFTTYAQFTVTAANHAAQIGDTVRYTLQGSANNSFSDGPSQTWALRTSSISSPVAYVQQAPIVTIDGNLHTNATVAQVLVGEDSTILYDQLSGTDFLNTGELTRSGRTVWTDPALRMRYPISYQDAYSDQYSGTITSFSNSQTIPRGGTSRVEATGYGSLQLPTGTLNDVLKITYIANYADTIFSGTNPIVINYVDTVESFYTPSIRYPVLVYFKKSNGTKTLEYMDVSNIIGVQALPSPFEALSLYPNPAQDQLQIEGLPLESNLRVTNAQGQVLREVIRVQADSHRLSTAELPPGVYSLTLQAGSYLETKLFVVQ